MCKHEFQLKQPLKCQQFEVSKAEDQMNDLTSIAQLIVPLENLTMRS